MKPFKLEDYEKMTESEMMMEVCLGLAEVCEGIGDLSNPKYAHVEQRKIANMATDFKAFARLYGLNGGCKHEDRILGYDKKHGLFERCKRCGVYF